MKKSPSPKPFPRAEAGAHFQRKGPFPGYGGVEGPPHSESPVGGPLAGALGGHLPLRASWCFSIFNKNTHFQVLNVVLQSVRIWEGNSGGGGWPKNKPFVCKLFHCQKWEPSRSPEGAQFRFPSNSLAAVPAAAITPPHVAVGQRGPPSAGTGLIPLPYNSFRVVQGRYAIGPGGQQPNHIIFVLIFSAFRFSSTAQPSNYQ